MAALIVDGERSEQWSKIDLTRAGDDGARRAKVALRGARGARVGAGLGPRSS
jgi:hypothetical protein